MGGKQAPRRGAVVALGPELEDALAELVALLAEDVALDVRVAEEALGVHLLEHAHKVVEAAASVSVVRLDE